MDKKVKVEFRKFLDGWKQENFEKMLKVVQITWKSNHPKFDLKALFPKKIEKYSMGEVKKITPAHVTVNVTVQIGGESKELVAHLVCETKPFTPSLKGQWGVNPTSIIKNLN